MCDTAPATLIPTKEMAAAPGTRERVAGQNEQEGIYMKKHMKLVIALVLALTLCATAFTALAAPP